MTPEIADDILHGTREIAQFLFGKPDDYRRIHHLMSSGRIPHFKIGGILCARRSTIIDWIERQENLTEEGYEMSLDPLDPTPRKIGRSS